MFSALKKLVGSEQAPGRDKNIPAGLQSMNQALQRRFAKGVQYNSECGPRRRAGRGGWRCLGPGGSARTRGSGWTGSRGSAQGSLLEGRHLTGDLQRRAVQRHWRSSGGGPRLARGPCRKRPLHNARVRARGWLVAACRLPPTRTPARAHTRGS